MFVIRWLNMVDRYEYYISDGRFKGDAIDEAVRFTLKKNALKTLTRMKQASKSILFKLNSEVYELPTETTGTISDPAGQRDNNNGSSCPPDAG